MRGFLELIGGVVVLIAVMGYFNQIMAFAFLIMVAVGFLYSVYKFAETANIYYFVCGLACAFLFSYVTFALVKYLFDMDFSIKSIANPLGVFLVLVMCCIRYIFKKAK